MGSGERSFALAETRGGCGGYGLQGEEDGSPQRARTLEDLERSLSATRTDEMPLEELLALYGYEVSDRISGNASEPTELPAHLPGMTLDKDQIAKDLLSGEEDEETQSPPDDLTPSVTSHASDLFRLHLRAHVQVGEGRDSSGGSSDDDSEASSTPSSEGRKDIMVGPQYQALIPPLSPYACQERAYENEDQLLWAPGVLPGEVVEDFLLRAQGWGGEDGASENPTSGDIVRDSEQALYELVKCSFNMDEALRRLHFNVKVFREELCAWSEEECRNFEHGYRVHGKNFHLIQANKVRTRSVGECVEYYYAWKKSDRHDYFTLQTTRLGRKKYSLQSGNMEDGEQDGEGSSRSHSPPQGPGAPPQLGPPSPPEGHELDLEKPEADSGFSVGVSERGCGGVPPGLATPREPQLPLCQHGDPQDPTADCPIPAGRPASSPPPPLSSLGAGAHAPPPELLGPGFYQLQLGPFGTDGPFALPTVALPTEAPPTASPSVFGPIGGFLCPPPVQHPRSLTQ
ncbi:mesoderm induction early response protein 2-like [Anguilla anguilla]|uniref:mesoderm induction early response protein 2-like n=1 Tax=Anguilla anguilla TaxID=7936 RepID=UPI0015AB446B|nr:mesoderm induction early response protein 2-like [Anguilla anguilla]XP_035279998.1 mesoderm induction early response protein 2-like [Anguilla anguilla]